MLSSIGIDIGAPPELVFRLAHEVEAWERLLPHYGRSRVVERRADGSAVIEFVARRPIIASLGVGLPVAWRARTWNEPGSLRLRFAHVAGVTRGMDVTWHIAATPAGCHVRIDHDFRPRMPGLAAFVDRWFTRAIAGRTLATFKTIAEAVSAIAADDPAPSAKSDRRPTTNPRT